MAYPPPAASHIAVAVRGPEARTNFPSADYTDAEVAAMEDHIRERHPAFPLEKVKMAYR
jgi:hypothetical protein